LPRHCDSDAGLDDLIELMSEAASAFIGGRMRRYFELMNHTDDFTLMPPTGGDTIHGSEATDEIITEMERFYKERSSHARGRPDTRFVGLRLTSR